MPDRPHYIERPSTRDNSNWVDVIRRPYNYDPTKINPRAERSVLHTDGSYRPCRPPLTTGS